MFRCPSKKIPLKQASLLLFYEVKFGSSLVFSSRDMGVDISCLLFVNETLRW